MTTFVETLLGLARAPKIKPPRDREPFCFDAGLALIRDTIVDRGYPQDEVEKRLALWYEAQGYDCWERFARIIDEVEAEIFTAAEMNQVWG